MKNTEAVGKMTFLMGQSEAHCNWTVDDIHRLILPPVALQQFRIWEVESHPVGFVTWAMLTDEAQQGYWDGTRLLQPDDWQAGENLWLIDFVAPYGGVRQMVREGRKHLRSVLGEGVLGRANRISRGKGWFAVT
mgnify:FL=1